MFRAYSYLTVNGQTHRLTTSAVETQAEADTLLSEMQAIGTSGGDLEQHVPGIGWVLADEAETAVIANRGRGD